MNKRKRKELKENGITLIALVVTIIVLLILAGVTITLALSDNGIINRAKDAEKTWGNATTNEEITMNHLESDIDTLASGEINNGEEPENNNLIPLADNFTWQGWSPDSNEIRFKAPEDANIKGNVCSGLTVGSGTVLSEVETCRHNGENWYTFFWDDVSSGYFELLSTNGWKSVNPSFEGPLKEYESEILEVGDTIITINGEVTVTNIETNVGENVMVYNLSVKSNNGNKNNNNYIANYIVAHNYVC